MKLGEVGKGRACSPEMEFLLTSISLSFHGLRLNVLWRKKKKTNSKKRAMAWLAYFAFLCVVSHF